MHDSNRIVIWASVILGAIILIIISMTLIKISKVESTCTLCALHPERKGHESSYNSKKIGNINYVPVEFVITPSFTIPPHTEASCNMQVEVIATPGIGRKPIHLDLSSTKVGFLTTHTFPAGPLTYKIKIYCNESKTDLVFEREYLTTISPEKIGKPCLTKSTISAHNVQLICESPHVVF